MSRFPPPKPEQIDLAIEYVKEHGARQEGRTCTYSDVFRAAALPEPQDAMNVEPQFVTEVMAAFHWRCREEVDPQPLDALVVNKSGAREGYPGAGYFKVNNVPDPLGKGATDPQMRAGFDFCKWEQQQCWDWGKRH